MFCHENNWRDDIINYYFCRTHESHTRYSDVSVGWGVIGGGNPGKVGYLDFLESVSSTSFGIRTRVLSALKIYIILFLFQSLKIWKKISG